MTAEVRRTVLLIVIAGIAWLALMVYLGWSGVIA